MLTAARSTALQFLGHEYRNLATGVADAIRVSQRIGDEQLGIPLNRPADGQLMMIRETKRAINVGSMRVYVLALFEADLGNLRDEWNEWLRENRDDLSELRRRHREDADAISAGELQVFLDALAADADQLGKRNRVTAPNLASLMLLVEEDGKSVLLTGDGHADEIIRGLEHYGRLAPGGGLHVDVLKVPHHGAEFNTTLDLARRVTADHYVFCGDGSHHNPDLAVVELYADARLGADDVRSPNPEAGRKFTMWFNCSATDGPTQREKHFREVVRMAERRADASGGRMRVRFMTGSSAELAV